MNEKAIPSEEKKDKLYWLKNDLYHRHFEYEEILRSPTAWLNDRIIGAAHGDYQSVLNLQKRRGAPYRAVKNEHIYFMMVLDTDYLLFVAMEGSRFLIV